MVLIRFHYIQSRSRAGLYDVLQKLIKDPHCDKFQLIPHIWNANQEKREIEMSKIPQKENFLGLERTDRF
jgi:hypothetical protein